MKSYQVNESDKERIRNLHRNYSVIKEQNLEYLQDFLQDIANFDVDEVLEELLDGSQRLQRFIKDSRGSRGGGEWDAESLMGIHELICDNLEKIIRVMPRR